MSGHTRWRPRGYDHEHPCPGAGCADFLRREGYDVPDDVDCCICWCDENDKPDPREIAE